MFKVERGNPSPEELAAALAVVRARAATAPAAQDGDGLLRRWSDPARVALRGLARPGAGAWRTTYWPH